MKRREFIKNAGIATGGISIVPSFVLGKQHIPPSDTLYVAAIGAGGRGAGVIQNLHDTQRVKFVALCDVDEKRAGDTFKKFSSVKRYKDFRQVYDKHLSEIDAVMVATPDHTHATIALPFIRSKKHAYVEKPLTHNIYEARLMATAAREYGVVTQMGNQGSSGDDLRRTKEWIDAGVIGKIRKVDCWTNRPVWPQGMKTIDQTETIPDTLDWDLWLGPAADRPYHSAYLPFKWRGWWDFGTGALGDMGCHIMETPFYTLELGHPTEAEASCTTVWVDDFVEADFKEACPPSSVVKLKFESKVHGEIQLNWYDGGLMPAMPEIIREDESIGNVDGGSVFYGDKGILITDTYSANPRLLKNSDSYGSWKEPKITIPRVKGSSSGHVRNWVDGCLKGEKTSSPFSYAGPLTEAVLMGNLAIKAFQYKKLKDGKKPTDWAPYDYPGRKKLLWNGDKMEITNYSQANEWVKRSYRDGWNLI